MIIRSLSRAPRSRPRAARLRAPDPGAGPGNRPPDGGVACPGSLELRRFMRNPGCSTGVRLVRMRPRIGQPVPVRRAAAQLAALLPGLRGHRGADPGAGWLPGTGCRAANLASTATGRYRVSPSSWPDFARNADYFRGALTGRGACTCPQICHLWIRVVSRRRGSSGLALPGSLQAGGGGGDEACAVRVRSWRLGRGVAGRRRRIRTAG
jgi:hypothetical protein